MTKQLRIYVEANPAQEKYINLPGDWNDMDDNERIDFQADEEQEFVFATVKHGSEVVDR